MKNMREDNIEGENPISKPNRYVRNNGEKYLRTDTFKMYSDDQEKLCSAYRNHLSSLIEGVRDDLKNAIYITTTVLGLIVTLATIIQIVFKGV